MGVHFQSGRYDGAYESRQLCVCIPILFHGRRLYRHLLYEASRLDQGNKAERHFRKNNRMDHFVGFLSANMLNTDLCLLHFLCRRPLRYKPTVAGDH
ncbi:hypothetical protein D3C80_1566930 [compost metagenome]